MDQPVTHGTKFVGTPEIHAPHDLGLEALDADMLRNMVHHSKFAFAILDADRQWIYVNPAGRAILEFGHGGLAGRPVPFPPTTGGRGPGTAR